MTSGDDTVHEVTAMDADAALAAMWQRYAEHRQALIERLRTPVLMVEDEAAQILGEGTISYAEVKRLAAGAFVNHQPPPAVEPYPPDNFGGQ